MPERSNPREKYKNDLLRATHNWALQVEAEYITRAREYLSTIRQNTEALVISQRLLDVIEAGVYPQFEYLDTQSANDFLQKVEYRQRIGQHQILVIYHSCQISTNYYDCEFWSESSHSLSTFVHKQVKRAKRSGLFLSRLSRIGVHEELYHYFWTAELSQKIWEAANTQNAQV